MTRAVQTNPAQPPAKPLMGDDAFGINRATIERIALEIKKWPR